MRAREAVERESVCEGGSGLLGGEVVRSELKLDASAFAILLRQRLRRNQLRRTGSGTKNIATENTESTEVFSQLGVLGKTCF